MVHSGIVDEYSRMVVVAVAAVQDLHYYSHCPAQYSALHAVVVAPLVDAQRRVYSALPLVQGVAADLDAVVGMMVGYCCWWGRALVVQKHSDCSCWDLNGYEDE